MRILARALMAALLLAACTIGETQVQGGGGSTGVDTEPTAATGPTASGPTAATGGGEFGSAVSVDVQSSAVTAAGATAAFFSCEGVFGTWRYTNQADFGGGISFDIDTTVDLSSGSGTMVFGDTIEIPQAGSITWEDTIDLEIRGTADAPTMVGTNVTHELSGSIPIPVETFQTFPENTEFPIVPGSDQC